MNDIGLTGLPVITNGREIDEMLADILFIYALMGALQAAFLTIHLINP